MSCSILIAQQCFTPDASIWENPWQSCQTSNNPNPVRGNGHWIMYDFGTAYTLSKSWIWNSNDPTTLQKGFRNVVIDYSIDGNNWTSVGNYEFPMGTGEAIYSGFAGPDFNQVQARYVIITALSNWGDVTCSSLAEVKFNLIPGTLNITVDNSGSCRIPSFVKAFVFNSTDALLIWEEIPFATNFKINYRVEGTTTWLEQTSNEFETYLEELSPATTYEYRLTILCGGVWSDDPTIRTFTTIAESNTCEAPITSNFIQYNEEETAIIWNEIPNATAYRVQYRLQGTSTWTTISTIENYADLFDLGNEATYEYQVQAQCPNGWTAFSQTFYINEQTIVLSVETIDFSANCEAEAASIVVQWTTASEQKEIRFLLERSEDLKNWTTVMELDNAINAQNLNKYLYEDHQYYAGENYYRLQQIESDGQVKHLGTINVLCLLPTELELFPNPVGNDLLTVKVNEEMIGEMVSLLITDVSGRLLHQQVLRLDEMQQLNVSALPKGMYWLTLQSPRGTISRKFVKIEE